MSDKRQLDSTCQLTASERKIMAIVLRSGEIARSAVTEKTDLSQQSVHRLVDSLEKRVYLRYGEARIVGRGKPSPTLFVDPDHYTSAGVSIGTEDVRFCLVTLAGKPLFEETLHFDPIRPDAVLDVLKAKLSDWTAANRTNRVLVGIGVSMQGFRGGAPDVFFPPLPLASWQGIALEALFNEALGLPAFAENNATSSAIAEHYLGAGAGHDCIAYLSFNHGFGCGIFAEGAAFRGAHGNAGEISAVYDKTELPRRPALSQLINVLSEHNIHTTSVRDLTARFQPDWPGVAEWLEDVKPQLQLALRALQATIDPGAIFFGGEAPDALRRLFVEIGRGTFRDQRLAMPDLVVSELQGDPAHLGAALLPLHRLIF
ncbi:ROK family transcriptional regulator [uncultured Roseibium sp.]|uniref:ROK family transcriptional regulator n=1 Tax=uncultured Roseibium sp. TaxID=1936171 RepID=UPI0032174948